MEHLRLMWNVKRCIMSCLTFWRSTGIQSYEICHENLGIRRKKKQSNFFYGFFCLIRSDGFRGFNSFVVLVEVYVGLVRFQKKRSSYLDVQIASKQKVARSFCLVPAIFQAKMQLVAAKNKKSKVENCCN